MPKSAGSVGQVSQRAGITWFSEEVSDGSGKEEVNGAWDEDEWEWARFYAVCNSEEGKADGGEPHDEEGRFGVAGDA